MNNYVYILDGGAYVNLTNKCGNACSFCIRLTGDGVKDTPLWLDRDATTDEVIEQFAELKDKLTKYEVVFCGYGEPTENLAVLKECAAFFKEMGYQTRLNTNGLGSLAAGRDITPELKDIIDTASVSLNNHNAQKYYELTNSTYGLKAHGGVIDFALGCKKQGIDTVFTVVDTIGESDIAECRALAEKLGIPLRVRKYIPNNYKD
ncbi:MAG: radical SAM protein [Clostridiales bacterium]|nr:radical SAM protein [Clostridiales bacterium]